MSPSSRRSPRKVRIDGPGQPAARLVGVYSAVVVDNADPQSRKRLKVTVPAVLGAQELWAKSCLPVGAAAVPVAGAQVWVAFEAGDPAAPVWLGTLWS
jgi:hypothetical protein